MSMFYIGAIIALAGSLSGIIVNFKDNPLAAFWAAISSVWIVFCATVVAWAT